MADNTNKIDELSIDIKVVEDGVAERIGAITKSISNLTKNLKEFDSVTKALQKINASTKNKSINKAILKKENVEGFKGIEKGLDSNSVKPQITPDDKSLADRVKDQKKLNDELDKGSKKVSTFSKLWRSIGRIAFYRAIRMSLKMVVDGAKEGIANIRSLDKELDNSLNKISASKTSLNNSFAALLTPVIKTIEPFLTRLSDGLARIVNRFTEAQAALKGQSTYTKILTSDTEEYQKSLEKANGTLLDFDTFTTLASKSTYSGVTTAETTMSKEEAEEITNKLENIKDTVIAIGGALALWKITSFLRDINSLSSVLGSVTTLTGVAGVIVGIYNTIEGIKNIINWDETTTGLQKVADILTVVFGVIAAIAGAIALTKAKTVVGLVAAGISFTAALGAIMSNIYSQKQQIKGYANGGGFNTADMFYANENGRTELIASTNNGGAVMNMEQLQSAIYNGMTMAMAQNGNGNSNIYLDGNKVGTFIASNTGFRNEANRRNSGLNWK